MLQISFFFQTKIKPHCQTVRTTLQMSIIFSEIPILQLVNQFNKIWILARNRCSQFVFIKIVMLMHCLKNVCYDSICCLLRRFNTTIKKFIKMWAKTSLNLWSLKLMACIKIQINTLRIIHSQESPWNSTRKCSRRSLAGLFTIRSLWPRK